MLHFQCLATGDFKTHSARAFDFESCAMDATDIAWSCQWFQIEEVLFVERHMACSATIDHPLIY